MSSEMGGVPGKPDAREELRHRVRPEARPVDTSQVVLRGGPDTRSLLRSHARRVNRLFVLDGAEVWAISVFVALDDVGVGSSRVDPADQAPVVRSRVPVNGRSAAKARLRSAPHVRTAALQLLLPGVDHAEELFDALGELQSNPYAGEQETGGQR